MNLRAIFERLVPTRRPSDRTRLHEAGSYAREMAFELTGRVGVVFGPVHKLRVADLGAGESDSETGRQVLAAPWRRLVSVETRGTEAGQRWETHAKALRHDVLKGRMRELFIEFDEKALDVGLMLNTLDRLPRAEGRSLLRRVEDFFKLGMVVFVYLPDDEKLELNHGGERKSIWKPEDFERLGYDVEVYEGLEQTEAGNAAGVWAIKRWG